MSSSEKTNYRKFYFKTAVIVLMAALLLAVLYWYKIPSIEEHKPIASVLELAPVVNTLKPEPPTVTFTEESQERGISYLHYNGAEGNKWLPEAMGSGIAILDVENDGDLDLFFTNGTSWEGQETVHNQLFINDGTGNFIDKSQSSGLAVSNYGTGVATADVNNDGFMDVFIAAVGANKLFINDGKGQFKQTTDNFKCDKTDWTTSTGFFDYDNDGDNDLLTLNYIEWSKDLDNQVNYQIEGIGKSYGPPTNFPGTQICLFENRGGSFFNVSEEVGFLEGGLSTRSKALGLLFWDINNDAWLDIIVANDTIANQVFINTGNKTFTEKAGVMGLGFDAAGKSTGAMGIDIAHFKNDQDIAIAIGNFGSEATSFYVSKSEAFFTDDSMLSGIGSPSRAVVTFGVFFFDYDLDGRLDFFQTNGHIENLIQQVESSATYEQKNQLFWNCGNDCKPTYQLINKAGELTSDSLVGRAAAYADLDADGDLDVIVNQVSAPAKVYINQQNLEHQWLTLNLSATDNRSLIGAKVVLTESTNTQKRVYSQTKSYQSQVQPWLTFGLGENPTLPVNISVIELNGQSHQKTFKTINQIVNWELSNTSELNYN